MVDTSTEAAQADGPPTRRRIDRTQIWTAVITAIGTALTAGIPAYLAGLQGGEQAVQSTPATTVTATPPTVTATTFITITATPGPGSSSAELPAGDDRGKSLLDLRATKLTGFKPRTAKVMNETYEQALVADGSCNAAEASYQIDGKYTSFSARAAIIDGSDPGTANFEVYIDDKVARSEEVTLRNWKEFEINNLSGAVHLKLVVQVCGGFWDMEVGWINPILK
ncbi:NPCBM/NEW2 domain-containing protein [Acrocarpospora sp. B8E8]